MLHSPWWIGAWIFGQGEIHTDTGSKPRRKSTGRPSNPTGSKSHSLRRPAQMLLPRWASPVRCRLQPRIPPPRPNYSYILVTPAAGDTSLRSVQAAATPLRVSGADFANLGYTETVVQLQTRRAAYAPVGRLGEKNEEFV